MFWFVFDLGFMSLSRIFHLYRANRSAKGGKNRRTRGETVWPSVSRTWFSHMWPERGSNHSGEKPIGLRVDSPMGPDCFVLSFYAMPCGHLLLSLWEWYTYMYLLATNDIHLEIQVTQKGKKFLKRSCGYMTQSFTPVKIQISARLL